MKWLFRIVVFGAAAGLQLIAASAVLEMWITMRGWLQVMATIGITPVLVAAMCMAFWMASDIMRNTEKRT
jgi:hypothetical protein